MLFSFFLKMARTKTTARRTDTYAKHTPTLCKDSSYEFRSAESAPQCVLKPVKQRDTLSQPVKSVLRKGDQVRTTKPLSEFGFPTKEFDGLLGKVKHITDKKVSVRFATNALSLPSKCQTKADVTLNLDAVQKWYV